MATYSNPRWFRFAALLVLAWLGLVMPAVAQERARLKELRLQAEQMEKQGDWEKACQLYDGILQHNRQSTDIKLRYRHCLRRFYQERRHLDPSYRKEMLTLSYPQALKLHSYVLTLLLENALDKHEVSADRLFRKGVAELRHALQSPVFLREHLPTVTARELQQFQARLDKLSQQEVSTISEATQQARAIALAAISDLSLPATATVLELTCGCCYAMDDYTVYLTPSQLRDLCAALKGETVGVGLKLEERNGKFFIADVQPGSTAAEAMLMPSEQVLSIDRKPLMGLSLAAAHELLQGEPNTKLEIEVYVDAREPRVVTLRRRALFTPSVYYEMKASNMGYVLITTFQETTPQELDSALLALTKMDMKGLILDVRGNSGGLFEAAVDTARRFLSSGVIVSTQNLDPKEDAIYQARNPAALTMPLVVLVNGETASAAEVLVGALKENKRGRIVGLTTFGKSSTQALIRLSPQEGVVYPGGLRITVARFLSPSGQNYAGRGISPHIVVALPALAMDMMGMATGDTQLEAALAEARRMIEDIR